MTVQMPLVYKVLKGRYLIGIVRWISIEWFE
ncbi:hypothetical protein Glo7428_1975 [Gloeocapsa sp. PCC 7428]|nr:hypothetical protein Glo7428_1975 [Gloeocapsa sp. PCC 7428]